MVKLLLDETCEKIFSLLLASDKKLRFNELHRTLNQIGLEMSKPTLIEHLNHLKKRRLVIRKKEGKQNVSYRVNWEKLEHLGEAIKTRQRLKHMLENEKVFKSFPLDEQVTYVHNILALRNLYRLRLEILDVLDPSKNFEHSIQYLFTNRFFEIFKIWLLESCRKNKSECKEKALNMIEYNIKRYTDILFDKKLL
ncbi:MAG: ArsR/SmtB family transcription factor [Candidatus Bathyarchaeia archaeon]